jgi:hypothetical protein
LVSSLVAGSALGVPALAAKGREEGQAMVQQVHQDEQVAQAMRGLHRRMLAQVETLLSRAVTDAASPRSAADAIGAPGGEMLIAGPALTPEARLAAADQPTEKVTFLGVATDRVSAVLAEQLNLARGVGLVVQYVEKGSPADQAGLKLHDIVEKFDDQWVINQDQFSVLVRMKKPGDEVTLTLLRGGQRLTVKAKLSEKEVPLTPVGGEAPGTPPLAPGMVGPQGMLVPGFQVRPGAEAAAGRAGAGPGWTFQRTSMHVKPDGTIEKTLVDDDLNIDLKQAADGKKTLVVKDRAGKELYNGAYDTAEDKTHVPVAAAAKVAALDEGVSLQPMGGPAGQSLATTPGQGATGTVMTRVDDQHAIVLEVNDGHKKATVRDQKGTIIFDGPVDTQKQLNAMPPDVAVKVKAMEAKLGE